MEIRANSKDYKKLKKIYDKNVTLDKEVVTLTEDEKAIQPVILVQSEGSLVEWSRGYKNVESLLMYGYVRIQKNCPYRIGKCICEKCSLYIVKNVTGDCSHVWGSYLK